MSERVPGRWYYVVRCHHCWSPIFVAEDRSQGAGKPIPFPDTHLSIACENAVCRKTDIYQASEATRYRTPGTVERC